MLSGRRSLWITLFLCKYLQRRSTAFLGIRHLLNPVNQLIETAVFLPHIQIRPTTIFKIEKFHNSWWPPKSQRYWRISASSLKYFSCLFYPSLLQLFYQKNLSLNRQHSRRHHLRLYLQYNSLMYYKMRPL